MTNPAPKLDRIASLLAEILAELRKNAPAGVAPDMPSGEVGAAGYRTGPSGVAKRGPGRPRKVVG